MSAFPDRDAEQPRPRRGSDLRRSGAGARYPADCRPSDGAGSLRARFFRGRSFPVSKLLRRGGGMLCRAFCGARSGSPGSGFCLSAGRHLCCDAFARAACAVGRNGNACIGLRHGGGGPVRSGLRILPGGRHSAAENRRRTACRHTAPRRSFGRRGRGPVSRRSGSL